MNGGTITLAALLILSAARLAGQDPNYETVLVPAIFDPSPGEQGALWKTELNAFNGADSPVHVFYSVIGCETATCVPDPLPPGFDGQLLFTPVPIDRPGQLIFVPRDNSGDITFHLRVRDLSREAETWGTEVPVVRERDFLEDHAELLDIPTDPRFRDNLRIYGVDGWQATVHVRYFASGTPDASGHDQLLSEGNLTLTNPGNFPYDPSYTSVVDFQNDPILSASPTLRIDVTPVTPGLRFWAFVSITNNETQHVTLVTP